MEIIKAHAVKNLCYVAAQKMTPKGIVIHSTGANNPNLKRYVDAPDEVGVNTYGNHWNNPKPSGKKVCVHAFVGYDKDKTVRIAEILPLDICAWGVGNGSLGSYNFDPAYIQIEVCEDALKNREYYESAFSLTAKYCASLCRRFSIDTENIVGHNEAYARGYATNHGDPEHWMKNFGENMDDFRGRVVAALGEDKANEKRAYSVVIGSYDSREDAEKIYFSALAAGFEDAFLAENPVCTPIPVEDGLRVGDTVKLRRGAPDYNGGSLASFVYDRTHTLTQINGDRAVISYKGTVIAAVRKDDLEKADAT